MATKEHLERAKSLLEQTAQGLPPDIDLEFRHMFGGMGAYVRGRMFAVLITEGLALKLAPEEQGDLLQEDGAYHWQHSKQYVVVPEKLHTPAALRPWMEKSVTYAMTLPLPKKKRR